MPEPIRVATGRPAKELADDLKERLRAALEPVCAIFEEASAAGLVMSFNVNRNGFGRYAVLDVTVVRPL